MSPVDERRNSEQRIIRILFSYIAFAKLEIIIRVVDRLLQRRAAESGQQLQRESHGKTASHERAGVAVDISSLVKFTSE